MRVLQGHIPVPSSRLVPGSAPQKALKEMFPIESGDINVENRIIPHLPGEQQVLGLGSEIEIAACWEIPQRAELCRLPPAQVLGAFLFPTGFEIKTPECSEQRWWFLPILTSPTDPVLPP